MKFFSHENFCHANFLHNTWIQMSGENLTKVTKIRIFDELFCPTKLPVKVLLNKYLAKSHLHLRELLVQSQQL